MPKGTTTGTRATAGDDSRISCLGLGRLATGADGALLLALPARLLALSSIPNLKDGAADIDADGGDRANPPFAPGRESHGNPSSQHELATVLANKHGAS